MSVELKIVFDGDEPGLAEHRLSLSSFGDPLVRLLSALQRTASGILAAALEDPNYGKRGAQLAAEAKLLDLELASIGNGSMDSVFVCTARPGRQLRLNGGFDQLAERTAHRLVSDIDAERQGKLANASVRRYLQSLPKGVRSQRYIAYADGKVLAEAQFGEAVLPQAPTALARLVKLRGRIVSVGFEPGASFISLKTDIRSVRCAASAEQVDAALRLRHQDVVAAILDGPKPALVWLRDAAEELPHVSMETTVEHLRTSWGETLRILAQ